MERNREARRASIVGSNGFNRRRHRTNSLRDSPDEDGGVELQESVRLRDRVKKDRDRERERERDLRERERDLRERSSRSKRRRAERLVNNRENIGGDYTSEESVDEDDDEYEEIAAASATTTGRLLQPVVGSISNHHHHNSHSSSLGQQPNSNSTNFSGSNHHLQHRKSFPPGPPSSSSSSKVFRAAPIWKPGDEIISVSVPRKARSASTKRSHDWISSSSHINGGGGAAGGEQILRQDSSSPVRQGLVSTATPSPAAPMSPSSSNALFRKKLKHSVNNGGLKLKPPKSSSRQHSSSNPEELEIEIAEVLYGLMTQSQGPPKKEDSREADRSSSDAPISNSPANNQNLGPNSTPLHSVAPKRKKPRQVPENSSYGPRSSPISAKLEMDQTAKSDISSPKLVKISGSTAENGFQTEGYSVNSQGQPVQPPEPTAPDSMKMDSEFKPVAEELWGSRNLVAKEDVISPSKKESPIVRYEDSICVDSTLIATASVAATMIKSNSTVSDVEIQREQKFEIDLMAPPQQTRSSPERETKIRSRTAAVDQKPVVPTVDAELKLVISKEREEEKEKSGKEHSATVAAEERKGEKAVESKKEIDLQFDFAKPQRNVDAVVNGAANKLEQQTKKEQQQEVPLKTNKEEPLNEKSCQPKSSLPFPVPMASWPGGLPPIGYMAAPLQGVVSMDSSSIAPAPIQPLFSQPRPKRCATHCYIARNIHCLQQMVKINPFWQAATGSASSFFGPKPSNLNVTSSDSHKDAAVRGPNNVQDKGHTVSNHAVKDKVSQADVISDSAKRNQQVLIQQALPTVAPSNLMGPTFIFPMNQQQATMAAASARLSGSSNPACSVGASASAAATAMSFNYPAMAANEAQYMAILQNNGYPFPIPPLAAPPNYRGTPATAQAAMPLFNGSFYSSQMIHPSQHLHPQQNTSASNGSSSSQKQLSSQQQRPQGSSINGGPHNQKSQPPQQLKHPNNQLVPSSRSRHSESEIGCEDSTQPTTSDSRGARASMNIYGQNFVMPMMNPQNFALMNPQAAFANAAASSPGNGSGSNPSEKKSQQQSFAMSFGPMNSAGTGPAMDISSMAQNHAIFQSFSEATRQNIQTMFATAAAAAQVAQKNSLRISEDDNKSGDAERKSSAAPKAQSGGGGGQSIAFTRSDLGDSPVSSVQTNSVMESSGRSLNGTSGASRSSRPVTPNAPNVHIQSQLQQQQQQQNAVSRSKAAQISEHLNSSSILHKMMGSGPSISPQWKNSTRTPPTPQASSTTTTLKNHSRTPAQTHTQISFGGNQKPATTSSHGGQAPPPCSNQSPSPSMIGSSTAPSVSKGTSASPRTSSGSTNTKIGHQSPSLSKNLPSVPNQKSPSILGNPSMQQQQQQQQLPKNMQQAQLFFSSPYSQAQSPHSTPMSSHSSVPNGFYMQRRRQDQQHQQPATLANASTNDPAKAIAAATSNVKGSGLSLQGTIQAAQFAAPSAGTTALLPNGFTYAHPVPAAVQVKPAEQKQPAGNDSLHPWQQPEKK